MRTPSLPPENRRTATLARWRGSPPGRRLAAFSVLSAVALAPSAASAEDNFITHFPDPAHSEGETIEITISRLGGGSGSPIPLTVEACGELDNSDFDGLPAELTYPADAPNVKLEVTIAKDGIPEPNERGGVSINGGYCDVEVSVNDKDIDKRSNVRIEKLSDASEAGQVGRFVIERDITSGSQVVAFRILGLGQTEPEYAAKDEAITGIDYEAFEQLISPISYFDPVGAVHFEDGQDRIELDVVAKDDSVVESKETVTIELYDPRWASFGTYEIVEAESTATLTIEDNDAAADRPIVTVEGEVYIDQGNGLSFPTSAQENTGEKGQWTLTRTGDVSEELTVKYAIASSWIAGVHFIEPSGQVTFPAGKKTAIVELEAIDDDLGTCAAAVHPDASTFNGDRRNGVKPVFLDLEAPDSGDAYVPGSPSRGMVRVLDRNGDYEDMVCIFGKGACASQNPIGQGEAVTFTARVGMAGVGRNEKNQLDVAWDFGDGTTPTDYRTQNTIEHTYDATGNYTVTLHVMQWSPWGNLGYVPKVSDTCMTLKQQYDNQCHVTSTTFDVSVASEGKPQRCEAKPLMVTSTGTPDSGVGDGAVDDQVPGSDDGSGNSNDGKDVGANEDAEGTTDAGCSCRIPTTDSRPWFSGLLALVAGLGVFGRRRRWSGGTTQRRD